MGVGSGRQEIGKDSRGLYSDGTYHMSYCEGNMKDCLSNTQHKKKKERKKTPSTAPTQEVCGGAGAGEQEMVRQGSTVILRPHFVSEMSSGK